MRRTRLDGALHGTRRACSLACIALVACAAQAHVPSAGSAHLHPTGEAGELHAEAEASWAKREERVALERAIAAWTRAAALDPEHAGTFVRLAEAEHLLGTSMLVLGWAPATDARAAFARGQRAADQALGLTPTVPEDTPAGELPAQPNATALYWRARNLRDWATTGDYLSELLVHVPAEQALLRSAEIDPSIDRGGPDRELGTFYASPPSYATRDLERAREHFERALASDPRSLPTRVARASTLAVAIQDRALFESDVRAVLEADPSAASDAAPENRLAQRRAAALLARADELFE